MGRSGDLVSSLTAERLPFRGWVSRTVTSCASNGGVMQTKRSSCSRL